MKARPTVAIGLTAPRLALPRCCAASAKWRLRNCQPVKALVFVFVFACAPARIKLGVLRYCICRVTVECADAASALEPLRRAIRGSRRGNWISRRTGRKKLGENFLGITSDGD